MSEYQQIANNHLAKIRELQDEKSRIENEIRKTNELVKAVINMMPDAEKAHYFNELDKYFTQQVGLTQAVREVLQGANGFLAAPQIKIILEARGYDFSKYTSNPLISIHSILKRFKRSEVDKGLWPDGTPSYRWKTKANKKAKVTIPTLIGGVKIK